MASLWNLYVKVNGFKCIDLAQMAIVTNGVFAITDFAMLVLPAYVVWNLQLPKRTKIGVGFLFTLGVLMTVACGAKTYYFHQFYLSYDASCELYIFGKHCLI
jgi:hypothetical protein